MAPIIETARLRLRGWTDADVEACADILADPEVMRYQASIVPRDHSIAYAQSMREGLEAKPYGRWVLQAKDAPGFAGIMVLDDIPYEVPFSPKVEIGWFLGRNAWGKGYATEAGLALLRYAFDELKWPEVIAMTTANNTPSRRVMERLHMTYNESDDFTHPRLPDGHELKACVVYRKRASDA